MRQPYFFILKAVSSFSIQFSLIQPCFCFFKSLTVVAGNACCSGRTDRDIISYERRSEDYLHGTGMIFASKSTSTPVLPVTHSKVSKPVKSLAQDTLQPAKMKLAKSHWATNKTTTLTATAEPASQTHNMPHHAPATGMSYASYSPNSLEPEFTAAFIALR